MRAIAVYILVFVVDVSLFFPFGVRVYACGERVTFIYFFFLVYSNINMKYGPLFYLILIYQQFSFDSFFNRTVEIKTTDRMTE